MIINNCALNRGKCPAGPLISGVHFRQKSCLPMTIGNKSLHCSAELISDNGGYLPRPDGRDEETASTKLDNLGSLFK